MKIFSKEEIKDFLISITVLTLIFSFKPFPNLGIDYQTLPQYAIIVVFVFLIHQLAHKFVAMRFGCITIYKIWPNGIFFGLILMLIGIPFAAPGVIMIYPYFFGRWGYKVKRLTTTENGIIGLSGPATNIFFAIIFTFFSGQFFNMLTLVNAWIAFFNLLPVPPLTGSKIMEWRIWVWGLMIALSVFIIALSMEMIPL